MLGTIGMSGTMTMNARVMRMLHALDQAEAAFEALVIERSPVVIPDDQPPAPARQSSTERDSGQGISTQGETIAVPLPARSASSG